MAPKLDVGEEEVQKREESRMSPKFRPQTIGRSGLWSLIGCKIVETKGEEDGFMLISLRIGLCVLY